MSLTLSGPLAEMPSALAPAGPQAARISELWWIYLAIMTVVFVVVMALLLRSLSARPTPAGPADDKRRKNRAVAAGVGLTTLILFGLLVASVGTGHALSALKGETGRTIEVIGHQWWWEIRYPDATPSRSVVTANELHLPVGEAVRLSLVSRDVIHSFWVPSLHGKKDLIPGHVNETYLRADRPGIYRGQCAEFCGLQHANMRLTVIAEDRATFEAWLEHQRQPAPPPSNELAKRGREVFEKGACIMCHAIQGTDAFATNGPDLTHLGDRQTIAAGTLPNTPGHLAGWVVDAQALKPGSNMPQVALPAEDLQALLAYLAELR